MEDPGPGQCPCAPGEMEWPAGPAPPCGPPTGRSELPRHLVHKPREAPPGRPARCHHKVWREPGLRGLGARPGPTLTPARRPGLSQGVRRGRGAPCPRSSSQPAGLLPAPCPLSTRPSIHPPVHPHSPSHSNRPPCFLPQPAPPHPPRPRPAHTASSQVHQLNAEVTWTLCLLPGPGKLKALHSSQVMGEAEACLPGQPTLVPARQTGWRQGPAGDCGTDLRGWVG